jgi:hypothetical protein
VKRTAAALFFTAALLLSAMALTQLTNLTTANFIGYAFYPTEPDTTSPVITVLSPAQNQTYTSTDIWLNFTVAKPETWFKLVEAWDSNGNQEIWVFGNITSVSYEVDGGEKQSIPVHDTSTIDAAYTNQTLNFSFNLTLPEGTHNVTVGVEAESYYVKYEYSTGPALAITVQGESEVVNFTVAEPPEPEPEPFPAALVATASGASIAIIAVGLLVYFKKRRQ